MEERNNNVMPFKANGPGSILRAELKERQISQTELAEKIGLGKSHVSELINGKRPFTKQISEKLEAALGIPAIHWVRLQLQYDYDVEATAEKESQTSIFLSARLLLENLLKRTATFTTSDINEIRQISNITRRYC